MNKTVGDIIECKDNQQILKQRFGIFKGSRPNAQDILNELNTKIVYKL